MEIRQYLAVLIRRWPILAIIIGLTALGGLVNFLRTPATYTAETRLLVRQQPTPDNLPYFTFDRYYNWFSDEFLVDDYTEIVGSRAFADQVVARLHEYPLTDGKPRFAIDTRGVLAGDVVGHLSADRQHRVLIVTAQSGDRGLADAMANAAADVLGAASTPNSAAPSLNPVQIQDKPMFGLLDASDANHVASNRGRALINAGVLVGLGLVAALALVFLIEYFDDRLRDEAEAERLLGAPVLGRIPRA